MFDAVFWTVDPPTLKLYVAAPSGVAVNVTLAPEQIVLSESLLVRLTTGLGLTVVVIVLLVDEQVLELVTTTRTPWPFSNVLVKYEGLVPV